MYIEGIDNMIRGTTDVFKFKLPYPQEELAWAVIKFWQTNNPSELLPIVKNKNNCYMAENSNELYVSLTAEETARFSDKYAAKVQLRAQHSVTGTVFGSRTKLVTVYPMPDDIIEEHPTLPGKNDEDFIIFDGKVIVG